MNDSSWRPPSGQSWSLLVFLRLFVLVAIAVGFAFSVVLGSRFGVEAWMIGTLGSASLGVVGLVAGRRGAGLEDPMWFVVLVVLLGFSSKAFYVYLGPEDRLKFLLLDMEPKDLLFAAVVMTLGLVCLVVGYLRGGVRWRLPLASRILADRWQPRRLIAAVGILLAIGLFSFLLFAIQVNASFESLSDLSSKRFIHEQGARFRGSLGYLRLGAKQIEVAFYLVLVWWASEKRRLWSRSALAVACLLIAASLFPIFVSSRQSFVFLVFRVVLIWTLLRGQPKLRHAATLAVIALVVVGSMLAMRRNVSNLEDFREYVNVGGLLEVTAGGRHFLDLTKTAHVLEGVPDVVGYRYGSTMVTWMALPVPRSLWPEKPAVGVGIEIGHLLFRTTERSGVPPGLVGELYMNFGLVGVGVGMLAFGFFLRSVHSTMAPHFPNKAAVLIYAIVIPHLAVGMVGSTVSGAMARLLQEIPFVLGVTYLLARDAEPAPADVGVVSEHRESAARLGPPRTARSS